MSNNYDNWERIVEVVLRREQLRQLALNSSREPSSSSISSSPSGWSTRIRDDQNIQLGSSSSTVDETDSVRLLSPDYEDIISRSVNPVAYASATKSFHIDKTTGKICYMIGAMDLNHGPFKYYWKLTPHADSRFSMVLEFRDIFGLDIRGKIETQLLSPKTRYAAYLVYKFEMSYKDLQPAKGIIKFINLDEDHDAERRATTLHLQPGLVGKSQQIAVSRPDGWLEVQLGMFYNDLGFDGPVEARLLEPSARLFNSLFIEGIEFRPTTNAKRESVSKENVKNQRKGIFSKLRISK